MQRKGKKLTQIYIRELSIDKILKKKMKHHQTIRNIALKKGNNNKYEIHMNKKFTIFSLFFPPSFAFA